MRWANTPSLFIVSSVRSSLWPASHYWSIRQTCNKQTMLWNTAGLSGLGGVEQCTTGRVEIMRALSTQRRAGQPDRAGREESQPEIDQDLRQRRRQPKCCYTPPDIPQIASASNWQFSSSTSPHVSQSGHKTWKHVGCFVCKVQISARSEFLDIFSLNLFKKAWVQIGAQIVTVFGFPFIF